MKRSRRDQLPARECNPLVRETQNEIFSLLKRNDCTQPPNNLELLIKNLHTIKENSNEAFMRLLLIGTGDEESSQFKKSFLASLVTFGKSSLLISWLSDLVSSKILSKEKCFEILIDQYEDKNLVYFLTKNIYPNHSSSINRSHILFLAQFLECKEIPIHKFVYYFESISDLKAVLSKEIPNIIQTFCNRYLDFISSLDTSDNNFLFICKCLLSIITTLSVDDQKLFNNLFQKLNQLSEKQLSTLFIDNIPFAYYLLKKGKQRKGNKFINILIKNTQMYQKLLESKQYDWSTVFGCKIQERLLTTFLKKLPNNLLLDCLKYLLKKRSPINRKQNYIIKFIDSQYKNFETKAWYDLLSVLEERNVISKCLVSTTCTFFNYQKLKVWLELFPFKERLPILLNIHEKLNIEKYSSDPSLRSLEDDIDYCFSRILSRNEFDDDMLFLKAFLSSSFSTICNLQPFSVKSMVDKLFQSSNVFDNQKNLASEVRKKLLCSSETWAWSGNVVLYLISKGYGADVLTLLKKFEESDDLLIFKSIFIDKKDFVSHYKRHYDTLFFFISNFSLPVINKFFEHIKYDNEKEKVFVLYLNLIKNIHSIIDKNLNEDPIFIQKLIESIVQFYSKMHLLGSHEMSIFNYFFAMLLSEIYTRGKLNLLTKELIFNISQIDDLLFLTFMVDSPNFVKNAILALKILSLNFQPVFLQKKAQRIFLFKNFSNDELGVLNNQPLEEEGADIIIKDALKHRKEGADIIIEGVIKHRNDAKSFYDVSMNLLKLFANPGQINLNKSFTHSDLFSSKDLAFVRKNLLTTSEDFLLKLTYYYLLLCIQPKPNKQQEEMMNLLVNEKINELNHNPKKVSHSLKLFSEYLQQRPSDEKSKANQSSVSFDRG